MIVDNPSVGREQEGEGGEGGTHTKSYTNTHTIPA